jgi:hypothetical protein
MWVALSHRLGALTEYKGKELDSTGGILSELLCHTFSTMMD